MTEHNLVEGQEVRITSVLAKDWQGLPRDGAPVLEDNRHVNPNKGALRLNLEGETGRLNRWSVFGQPMLGQQWYVSVHGNHYPLEQLTVEPV